MEVCERRRQAVLIQDKNAARPAARMARGPHLRRLSVTHQVPGRGGAIEFRHFLVFVCLN